MRLMINSFLISGNTLEKYNGTDYIYLNYVY